MIVFERFGHTFKIRNDDWKGLRERFNLNNIKPGNCYYNILIPCSLCQRYKNNYCLNCPFRVLESNHSAKYGCAIFLTKFFEVTKFTTFTDKLSWTKIENEEVRKQLKKLNKIMDKIEKENQHETKTKLTHKE